jgi:hypothetical protein
MTMPPGDPRLSPERLHALKHHLLSEIGRPERARSRRWLVAAPVTAGVLVAALATGIVLRHGDEAPVPDATVLVLRGDDAAPAFLNRVALVAGTRPRTTIGTDQFVYIKSRVAWTGQDGMDGARTLDKVHDREIWIAQTVSEGMFIERGERVGIVGVKPNATTVDLPVDPDRLLAKIYADTEGQGNTPDGAAFSTIGDLLRESLMPPEVTAALYRAAAKIPGVVLVSDSVDATGRHGVAVARVELGERTEWIFDRNTFDYLGERSYLVEDTSGGKAGMLTGTTAVTERAVVDEMGERP